MFFPESVSRVLKLAFHEISFFSSLYVVSVANTVRAIMACNLVNLGTWGR